MRWNLRLTAAERGIWKSTDMRRQLADAGLVISAGKMSHLWSGRPVTIRLEDLQVICSTLGWHTQRSSARPGTRARAVGRPGGGGPSSSQSCGRAAGEGPIRRRHAGSGETTGVSTRRRRGPRDYVAAGTGQQLFFADLPVPSAPGEPRPPRGHRPRLNGR